MTAEITGFARAHVGALSNRRFCGWDHGVSDVWDCRTSDGQRVFVMCCREKSDQEVHSHRAWAPHLDDRCPQLLAADGEVYRYEARGRAHLTRLRSNHER